MGGRRSGRRVVRVRRRAWIVGVIALALLGFLYYRPVQAYFKAQDTLEHRANEVRALTRENARLSRELRLDETGATLVREARKLGLVRSDETLFIVKGIDAWRKANGVRAGDD